jgi:signal transduction histidine kinase
MFFQANDNAVGSGLGLYIVKETLEKIQGDIRVQSEVGKGTEFIVTLPIEIDETLLRV